MKKQLIFSTLVGVLGFLLPATTFAAFVSPAVPMQPAVTPQSLAAQLSQISSELSSGTPGTATITLSPGQTTTQASSTAAGGLLQIGLPTFAYIKPDPAQVPAQPIINIAEVSLQFLPCITSSPSVCVTMASSSYPKMTADLANGADTGYLHYLVTLTNLSSTTATLQVTDTSFFSNLQNQLNSLAAQVHTLLGS